MNGRGHIPPLVVGALYRDLGSKRGGLGLVRLKDVSENTLRYIPMGSGATGKTVHKMSRDGFLRRYAPVKLPKGTRP